MLANKPPSFLSDTLSVLGFVLEKSPPTVALGVNRPVEGVVDPNRPVVELLKREEVGGLF